jgi:hypothetical protein
MIDVFLEQLTMATNNGLYLLALGSALTIPDICGALEAADGEAKPHRYIAWYNANVVPGHGPESMDGAACYWFRCGFLHQGRAAHPKSRYSTILFVEPSPSAPVRHMWEMNGALCVDVRLFCYDLIHAAREWNERARGTPHYETNIRKFITRYPNGLAPYIVGPPVIS